MTVYVRLFYEFFKAGLFAFGGGLATLPFLSDIGRETGWYTQAQLMDMLAVSESTPGSMGVNVATYAGFTAAGVPGAVVATLGEVTPSILVILVVAAVLQQFRQNRYVEAAFYGLRPASTGLIASSGLMVVTVALLRTDLFLHTGNAADLFNWPALALAAVLLVLTNWKPTKKLHPIVFIAAAAAAGVVFRF